MRLGGEVHDHVRTGDGRRDELGVADIAVDERVAPVLDDVGERRRVARVGQRIEVDDLHVVGLLEHVADEVRPDEAGAAGDDEPHRRPSVISMSA